MCNLPRIGTYLHFFGECSALSLFWSPLAHDIPFLLEKDGVLMPDLFFLNNFSELALSPQQRNLLLAALTAAKKMLVSRWVPPHLMTRRVWGLSLLGIVSILSVARIHGAKTKTLKTCNAIFDIVQSIISSFWCKMYFLFVYIFYLSCDWVLHFVLFSTAVSCFFGTVWVAVWTGVLYFVLYWNDCLIKIIDHKNRYCKDYIL